MRGGSAGKDAKNEQMLGAIRTARDILGEGKLLAGVSGKAINSGMPISSSFSLLHFLIHV